MYFNKNRLKNQLVAVQRSLEMCYSPMRYWRRGGLLKPQLDEVPMWSWRSMDAGSPTSRAVSDSVSMIM